MTDAPAAPLTAHQIITSSDNPNWRTPEWLRKALRREFRIVLDAAADPLSKVVDHYLGPGSDLLDNAIIGVPWWDIVDSFMLERKGDEAIFVNPPSSRKQGIDIVPFIRAAAEAGLRGTTLAVIPYAPQTKWWRAYVESDIYRATEVRKFPFRVQFEPPPGHTGADTGSNINQVVVIWKPTDAFPGPWGPQVRYWTPEELYEGQPGAADEAREASEGAEGGEGDQAADDSDTQPPARSAPAQDRAARAVVPGKAKAVTRRPVQRPRHGAKRDRPARKGR